MSAGPFGGGRDEVQAEISRIADEAYDWGRLGIEVTGVVLDGPEAHVLCERSVTASMIVMGARGMGGFTGLPIGSISLEVAAHAHCPVVVIRENIRVPDSRPIAVGVDDSPEGRLAVGLAIEEASLRGVALSAVRGSGPPPPQPWRAEGGIASTRNEWAAGEQHIVDDVVTGWRECYPNVAVTTSLMPVTAAHALTVASRDAQLMVIGSRGSGGFTGLPLGSVGQQPLHHGLCPVMIVREAVEPAAPSVAAAAGPATLRLSRTPR